ncbi:MAG: hypothetical protein J0M18_18480 [Ignavibacteria bacterium]|nr:hypothetical protein [Ignavibacteria bacterium]
MPELTTNPYSANFNDASFAKRRQFTFVSRFTIGGIGEALAFNIPKMPESFMSIERIEVSFIGATDNAAAYYTDSNAFSGYFKLNLKDSSQSKTYFTYVLPITNNYFLAPGTIFDDAVLGTGVLMQALYPEIVLKSNIAADITTLFDSFDMHFNFVVRDYPKNNYRMTSGGITPKQ